MNPLATVIIFALQEFIKIAPGAISAFRDLFNVAEPTPADWDALKAKLNSKTYADYDPDPRLK